MRDIKFRGQAVNALGWIYGGSIIKFKDGEEILTYMPSMSKKCVAYHDDIDDITNIEGCFYKVENVCLFTGIKDKNGVEIYEGDIIEREVYGENVVGKIVWKDSGITGFWLAVKNGDGTSFYPIGRGQYDDDEGELCNDIVIGNIYENLEFANKGEINIMCDECEYAEDCFGEEDCVYDEDGNLKEAEENNI